MGMSMTSMQQCNSADLELELKHLFLFLQCGLTRYSTNPPHTASIVLLALLWSSCDGERVVPDIHHDGSGVGMGRHGWELKAGQNKQDKEKRKRMDEKPGSEKRVQQWEFDRPLAGFCGTPE